MAVHILGIRHHGVGSARQVAAQLESIQPDMVLVEGPPEIQKVFHYVGTEELRPPAAIMVYDMADPKTSTFYPFAEYSPEWVAIQYANSRNIPVRAMDLPAAISFAKRKQDIQESSIEDTESVVPARDPLSILAESLDFSSGERFWEHHFEYSSGESGEHFESVMHVMQTLREEGLESSLDAENVDREAYMRKVITEVQNEMYTNIAIVCGAWHGPSLTELTKQEKADKKTLKALPKSKVKIATTWIPWTNSRLSMFSGYGAGIQSPGWYEHLWKSDELTEIQWLTRVAEVFRKQGTDMSTAHVIETYRLARSLAQIRNKHFVSLQEMNDAVLSVMCMGDEILLKLVEEELIVGEKMGSVPADIPKMPLQEDFEKTIKSLRLKLTAAPKQHDLDLRKEIDRGRSILFHRLEILEFEWVDRTYSRSKGTFKESWKLQWSPEMMINLIDKAYLGNTIEAAAQAIVIKRCNQSVQVNEIAELIQLSIPSELFDQLNILLDKINELSSISSDILDLMKAVPHLVDVSRYGDVRQTDLTILNVIVAQLLVKVCAGLANACYGLDEANSIAMFEQIAGLNRSIKIYSDDLATQQWYDALHQTLAKDGVHQVIKGCVCRLLLDAQQFKEEEADQQISYALSINNDPAHVASWLEGFLKGSGMILIYDHRLWNLIYGWVESLESEMFMELLPMLRRSFSKFEYGERRQIGEKAKSGLVNESQSSATFSEDNFDTAAAESILPTIANFLKTEQS